MTPAELDALAALAEAATPGPWRSGTTYASVCGDDDAVCAHGPIHGGGRSRATADHHDAAAWDAAFIAASRDAVPALIAEVRRLREREAVLAPLVEAVRKTRAKLKPHTDRVKREILAGCWDGMSDALSDSGLGDLIDAENAARDALADALLPLFPPEPK